MKLTLDSTPASVSAALVALVAGYGTDSLSVSHGSALSFEGSSKLRDVLTSLATKKHRSDLTGASPSEVAQVQDWFGILEDAEKSGLLNRAFLERLNTHFLASSFLSASAFQPMIVDYAVWAAVREQLQALKPEDLPNLSRWARYIVASIPRNAATQAWVKVPLTSNELPQALQSRIVELDLLAAAVADSKLRSAVPAPAAAGQAGKNVAAGPPAAAAGDKAAKPAKDAKTAAPAAASSSSTSAPPAKDASAGGKEKKEKAPKAAAPAKGAAAAAGSEVAQVYRVDFRVGKILSVANHPTEARLYVEQIDVGEEKPRTVVSGLAEHFKADELKDKLVVLMVNLKSGDIKGVASNGRVMVATGADGKKELATPPAGAKIGERITFATVPADKAPDAELAPKRLHEILKGLKTNADKVVQYDGADFQTTAGPVTVSTVANGEVA